ncbi:MAG: PP2C family protein-serine/threonine phosphatase [Oscillospiraceae bacterium]
MQYASYSAAGGRPCNEDTVLVRQLDGERLCAVLADGLGGHGGGEAASSAAARTILDGWQGGATPQSLCELVRKAHQQVLSMQTPRCQMKTTVVVLALEKGRFDWAYAGDSRLYHFAGGRLVWQTRDHSASQIAVLLGQITPEEIRFHEDRSHIYRALGQQGGGEADAGETALEPGSHAFLLCSDGFWEYVYESEMERELAAAASPQDWLDRMRALLNSRIPADNDNNTAAAVWVTA